jgi:hypothetical protein
MPLITALGWGIVQDHLPNPSLISRPAKIAEMISLSCAVSVETKISDVGDWGTPVYRREWQKSFRPRRMDFTWI